MTRSPELARPWQVTAAGLISVTVGLLVVLIHLRLSGQLLSHRDELRPADLSEGQFVALILLNTLVRILVPAVAITLGALVLRGSSTGRYLLIGFWGVVVIAVICLQGRAIEGLPAPLILLAGMAVPILLLCSRGAFGWFTTSREPGGPLKLELRIRDEPAGFRGLLVLCPAIALLAISCGLAVKDEVPDALVALTIDPLILIVLGVLLVFGLRALDHPGTKRWASAGITIVVLTPVISSLAGLVAIVTS